MTGKADVLQGTLDLLVLKTVATEPMHGYCIAQRINLTSRALLTIPQGSLYPALHRLEKRGCLSAQWVDTDTGRRAKVYRLTRKGERELEREIADWQRLTQAVGWILRA
jgi:transcriptional regulator